MGLKAGGVYAWGPDRRCGFARIAIHRACERRKSAMRRGADGLQIATEDLSSHATAHETIGEKRAASAPCCTSVTWPLHSGVMPERGCRFLWSLPNGIQPRVPQSLSRTVTSNWRAPTVNTWRKVMPRPSIARVFGVLQFFVVNRLRNAAGSKRPACR